MHICDCGQHYSNLDALAACQAAGHSAAPGIELADAEREARLSGAEPAIESFPLHRKADTDYTGLLGAMDKASGRLTDECFPDLRPSVLDIVRSCPPSAELVRLLAKLSTEHVSAGKTDLAAELLSLALCARSALRDGRALG